MRRDTARRGGRGPVLAGQAGERVVGITSPKVRIPSASRPGRFRIPDELTEVSLREVKNVLTLSYTTQLRDLLTFVQRTGRTFILEVRKRTKLSGPLQELVNSGLIELRRTLP